VTVTSGVVYGHALVGRPHLELAPLRLDLYRPSGAFPGPRPVVVAIHGGGFVAQSRTDPGIVRIARALAARGVVVASIDYRLLGQAPVPSPRVARLVGALARQPITAAMACAVDDTLTALAYLRGHAGALGIDAGRLGLVGASAGAVTADHVAYALDGYDIARPRIRFVASLWGGILLPPAPGTGSLGADQLDPGEAALFAVHDTGDRTVAVEYDDELVARAELERVPVEYYRIPGGGHGFAHSRFFTYDVGRGQTPFERLLTFATRWLAAPRP
jgi:acetyl esterase/lipase